VAAAAVPAALAETFLEALRNRSSLAPVVGLQTSKPPRGGECATFIAQVRTRCKPNRPRVPRISWGMSTAPELPVTAIVAPGATPARWAIVLPGIYGRGRNWTTVSRQAAARRPEWGLALADLRLHGDAPPFPPPHTLAAVAGDVAALARAMAGRGQPVAAVIGHSFGGKVALSLAPALMGVRQIWVVDSTPETRPPSGSAWEMLAIVRALPERFASRADAVDALEHQGLSAGVATWMATNLRREGDGFVWTLDFDAMEALLQDFFATDLWPIVESPPPGVALHFVKGNQSSTLSESACDRIGALQAQGAAVHLHRVQSGHWVHTENPAAMVDLLAAHLD
jgi:esterase